MYLEYFSRSSDFKHFRPTSLPPFFLLFSFPCSLCFYFSSFLFSILSTSGYFTNSAHSRCYYSFFLHYTHYFILFYFLLPVISFLFFCRGIPGACTNTHTHIMKLDCAVVFPSRCLPGNRPHPCMVYFPFSCPPPHVGIRS